MREFSFEDYLCCSLYTATFLGFIIMWVKGYLSSLSTDVLSYIIIGSTLIFLSCLFVMVNAHDNSKKKLENKLQREINDLKLSISNKEIEIKRLSTKLDKQEERIENFINSNSPFKDVAEMAKIIELSIFQDSEEFLKHKRRPAIKAAEEVKSMRERLHNFISQSKENQYKLQFILNIFPDIEYYLINDDVSALSQFSSVVEFNNNRDTARDYLSDEEYRNLSQTERNQLALDRYIQNRSKSKWMIGRDYELSCAWAYEQVGCTVCRNGIETKFNDHGRDLIITFPKTGIKWIVQCKHWANGFDIHENVIMQLYGSKIAFDIEHKISSSMTKAILMVPEFSSITETALQYAKYLGVDIVRRNMGDFPRIKCNINGSSKIYHLPFDQQYDRTKIDKDGEFYALTVLEAESKGFRRALKHII